MISIDNSKECHEVELSKKAEELQILFATAIVNPNGPTFNVYYVDTSSESESSDLYQVNIHPTSDSIQKIASLKWSSGGASLKEIQFFSDFFNGSLPTLFLKGNLLEKETFHQIISFYIDSVDDSLRTYQYVKKYEGKPYQRVSAEMRGAVESILGKKSDENAGLFKKLFGKKNEKINNVDNKDFIKALTKETNVIEEIKALFMAYNGSIENVIPAGMVQLDFRAFINVFSHVAIQCNVDLTKLKK
jgi:hypothetical protein